MKFSRILLAAVVAVVAVQRRAGATLYLTQWGGGNTLGNLVRIHQSTGAVLGTTDTGMDGPIGVAQGPDGNIYVASQLDGGTIARYDAATGAYLNTFIANGPGVPVKATAPRRRFSPSRRSAIASGSSEARSMSATRVRTEPRRARF